MSDYVNGKNTLLKRPEPGRPIYSVQKEEKDIKIDTDAIANAVIKAISGKLSSGAVIGSVHNGTRDDFDNSASLKKLADVMTNREEKESNLNGLGNIKETKKDKKETDKTIDILSQLE